MDSNKIFDNIFDTTKNILSEITKITEDDILLESSLKKDLNMDSLSAVEAVLSIEEEFNIEIQEDDVENFDTVNDICRYIFEIIDK